MSRRIPDPFVGWRGRIFYFKTRGHVTRIHGPRAAVVNQVRKFLTAAREVATDQPELLEMIDRELRALNDNGDGA